MTQLGDFHIKESTGWTSRGQPPGWIVTVVIVVLLAFALGVYWFLGRGSEEVPVEAVIEAPPQAVAPPPSLVEPEIEAVETPPLDESDEVVRSLVGAVSSHPRLASWLVSDGIIRRFVVIVDNIADGNNPAQHMTFMRPESRFSTTGAGISLGIDPESYQRYDMHAQVINSLDTQGTADLYLTLEPLISEAYIELGNPDRPFARTLERAFISLLSVPVNDSRPTLAEYAPFFQYSDERLESLTPAQKQFLGVGPNNVRTVQTKLRQLALAIGISDSRLP